MTAKSNSWILGWAYDPALEAHLDATGIDYTREVIPVSEIDLKQSENQSGRIGDRLNREVVAEYAESMLNGDVFPAILIGERDGKKIVISGNHRIHAAVDSMRENVAAYVLLEYDEMVWSTLARTCNSTLGWKPSRPELLIQARFLIDKTGCSAKDAAKLMHISKQVLEKSIRASKLREMLSAVNIPAGNLSDSQADCLARLSAINKRVAYELARVVVAAKKTMGQGTIDEIVKDIRSCDSEAEMLERVEAVKRLRSAVEKPPHRLMNLPKRALFLGALSRLRGLLGQAELGLGTVQITEPTEVVSVRKDIAWIRSRLAEICRGQ